MGSTISRETSMNTARGVHVRPGWRWLLPTLLLLAVSAGCTGWREYVGNGFKVGPNYCRPAASVADQWIDSTETALDTRRTEDAAWWRTLNDPILDSLVDSAYRQNLTLRVAGLRVPRSPCPESHCRGRTVPAVAERLWQL